MSEFFTPALVPADPTANATDLLVDRLAIDPEAPLFALPTGDEKTIARDYAVSFGGNAVTAGFACARLGIAPSIHAPICTFRPCSRSRPNPGGISSARLSSPSRMRRSRSV